MLLTVFWRKKRAKSVSAEKWKSYECRSYLFSVSMKLQFHKTWITLTSNSKTLQIFFSCVYNTIYTFAKFLLRLLILFALAVLCTLSQILPYACKSLWRKINFIPLALETGGGSKGVISPRSRTRALSVVYIAVDDGSAPQTEANLSLTCLKEACADAHSVLKSMSYERIALGTTEILDSFYNAGKLWHVHKIFPKCICKQLLF